MRKAARRAHTTPSRVCVSWTRRASTPCSSIRPSASAGRVTSRTAHSPPRTRAPTTGGWPSSAAPRRLYPVAHISLLDPEGAVEETLRARKDGCVGIYLSPDLAARGGRHFDDPAFARFWETAQDLEMPVGFHVVVRDRQWFRQWQRKDPSDGLFSIAFLAIDVMAAFTQM